MDQNEKCCKFKENSTRQILGFGKVVKKSSKSIDNVYLVDGLKFNLLSVSQLCDKGN